MPFVTASTHCRRLPRLTRLGFHEPRYCLLLGSGAIIVQVLNARIGKDQDMGNHLWGMRPMAKYVSSRVLGAIRCRYLNVALCVALLMVLGCGEGDQSRRDRLFKVASVERAAKGGQHVQETVRYWTSDPRTAQPRFGYGQGFVLDPIDTATVDIGQLSLEVLCAYSMGPRTHIGFLLHNDTSAPVVFRWPDLGLTPRAFSWTLGRKGAAEVGKRLPPQAMYLCINGVVPVLIDNGYPKDYPSEGISEDAFWLPRLPGGTEQISTDTSIQLEVPPHSEAVLTACFRCNKITKAGVELGFLIGEEMVSLTFELEVK